MSKIEWKELLGWTEEQLEDLRYAGYAYIRQGKYDIALPIFEALTVLNKENAYDAQTLGALFLELGQPAKAAKALDRALKLETDHAPTLLNFTKALFMLGKKSEGLKLAKMLKNESDPKIANSAWALILAYE
ncbi:MAG: CDC27 family protein [Chlamydiota bacterium]|nr:CDC27 family protein [Chlamydiota bacterium]